MNVIPFVDSNEDAEDELESISVEWVAVNFAMTENSNQSKNFIDKLVQ